MKKIISFMTAVSLLSCQPLSTVISAEEISQTQSAQKEILAISLKNEITATNGMFTLIYDTEKLTAEDIVLNEALETALTAVNTETPGKIIIGFASSEPVTIYGSIAEITFSNTDTDEFILKHCSFSTDELVILKEDGTETNVSTEGIELAKIFSEPYAAVSHETSDEQGHLPVYISIERNSEFTNGLFIVRYDTDMLTFNECKPCELMKNSLCEINETEPGTIKIAFVSGQPVTDTGNAFLLDFTGKKNGLTEIELEASEFFWLSEDGEYKKDYSQNVNGNLVNVEMAEKIIHLHRSVNEENTAVIDISENTGVTNGMFTVTYDPSAAKFECAEAGSDFPGVIAEINETEPGTVKIAFISNERITSGGDLIKLHFTQTDQKSCPLGIKVNEFYEVTTSGTVRKIPFTEISGSLTETEPVITEPDPKACDVNDDGAVSIGDLIAIIRKILGESKTEYDKAYDVNSDGVVDSIDALLLKKIIMK